MSLYPDLNPYYVDDDHDMRLIMNESWRANIQLQQQFFNEADIDTRFLAGDQSLWNQLYASNPVMNRRMFQFNRIRRIINLVEGYQRKNRKTTIVTPVENSEQETADQLSKTVMWSMNQCGGYNTISDAFGGALTTGLNALSVWMDYRSDPINGEIKIDNVSYNGIMIDPTFKKKDLSDANFIWRRKWMSKKQIISLLPDRKKEIESMPYMANRDDKFIYLPENSQFTMNKLLAYDEYWHSDYRPITNIVDTESGDIMEWTGDKDALKLFLRQYPYVKTIESQKQTCKLAISVGGRVMYNGPHPYGIDKYPFVPVFGYFYPDIPYFALKMQGIVRGLRDSQYIYNRKMVIMNDLLESQINSGIKFKESALVDPDDAFLSGQGRRLAIRDSAQMSDVETIPAPEVPASMLQLSQLMADEMQNISGVNEELLGSAVDDKAGVLSMLRQGAGLTTLQTLFDNLDQSQKMLGDIFIDLIQKNFTPAKIKRITGKEPTEQFTSKAFQKYGCNVEEGSLTTSQKQMEFQQLLQLRELGLPIPNSIIIDKAQMQGKGDLMAAIKAEEEQRAQQEQQAQQQQMEQQAVVTQSLQAKSESDHALAQERMAKIQLDQAINVERMARVNEERQQGTLARIKAAKELTEIDLNQLQKMLEILKDLQGDEPQNVAQQNVQPMQNKLLG